MMNFAFELFDNKGNKLNEKFELYDSANKKTIERGKVIQRRLYDIYELDVLYQCEDNTNNCTVKLEDRSSFFKLMVYYNGYNFDSQKEIPLKG